MGNLRRDVGAALALIWFIVVGSELHYGPDDMPHGSFFEWAVVVVTLGLAFYIDHAITRAEREADEFEREREDFRRSQLDRAWEERDRAREEARNAKAEAAALSKRAQEALPEK